MLSMASVGKTAISNLQSRSSVDRGCSLSKVSVVDGASLRRQLIQVRVAARADSQATAKYCYGLASHKS